MNERCEKAVNDIVEDFERIHAKWQELKSAYADFQDRKKELELLLQGYQADFEANEARGYPSEEDKATICKSISEYDNNELADVIGRFCPDLGALAGEAKIEFTAQAFIREVVKRLTEKGKRN